MQRAPCPWEPRSLMPVRAVDRVLATLYSRSFLFAGVGETRGPRRYRRPPARAPPPRRVWCYSHIYTVVMRWGAAAGRRARAARAAGCADRSTSLYTEIEQV